MLWTTVQDPRTYRGGQRHYPGQTRSRPSRDRRGGPAVTRSPLATVAAALLLAVAFGGCRPADEPEPRDRGEAARENLEETGRELGDDLSEAGRDLGEGLAEAGRDVGEGLADAGRAAAEGAQELGERVEPHLRDAALTAAVKGRLAADPEVDALAIDVDTVDGVVTLSGKVDSAAQRDEAAELARGTDGVREVVNRIEVGPRGN